MTVNSMQEASQRKNTSQCTKACKFSHPYFHHIEIANISDMKKALPNSQQSTPEPRLENKLLEADCQMLENINTVKQRQANETRQRQKKSG